MIEKNTIASRRGRPPRTEEHLAATRSTVILATRELFAMHRYKNISMRKIAEKANCRPSTLYALFPNKNELLHQTLEVIYSELTSLLEDCYKKSNESDRLKNLCYVQLDFWLHRPGDYKAIFFIEDIHVNSEKVNYLKRSTFFQLEIYTRVIIEDQLRGELRAGDPEEIKNILLCSIIGTVLSFTNIFQYKSEFFEKSKEKTIEYLILGLKQINLD